MQTTPTGPIHWLGNIYIGKFENIFNQLCFGKSFLAQNTDLGT